MPEPTFDPSPDTTYTQPVEVAIRCSVPGAAIRYTADGSDPNDQSPLYLNRILVSRTTTICARAYKDGWQPSPKVCVTYTLTCAAPTFSPPAGAYPAAQWITIRSQSPGVTIRYTTDGTTPDALSPPFPDSIHVTSSLTLKAIAMREGWTSSPVVTAEYVIMPTLTAPTFDPTGGVYSTPKSVGLSCATAGAEIRYTTDGSDPDASSPLYLNRILVDSTKTICARCYKNGWNPSPVACATYSFACAEPTFDPPAGPFGDPIQVTIASLTPGVTIHFARHGLTPTEADSVYTRPIVVAVSDTITALAMRRGWTTSPVGTAVYIRRTVPTPTFDHRAGVYQDAIDVTIACTDHDAAIYYTLNGSPPDENSSRYNAPVHISANKTLRARAFREGWAPSEIATADYIIGLFYDFDQWDGNFVSQAGWQWGTPDSTELRPYSGAKLWAMTLSGYPRTYSSYVLVSPSWQLKEGAELSFWYKHSFVYVSYCIDVARVYLSTNGGIDWTQLTSKQGNVDYRGTEWNWKQASYDLSAYANQNVVVKFDVYEYCNGGYGWFIDDLQVTHATELKKARPQR
jgi:hypothetical protein